MNLTSVRKEIINAKENAGFLKKGWNPIYSVDKAAKILIIGQAPGRIAQETGIPWNDKSGDNLREWLGITKEKFYDKKTVALIPMDFYFPGSYERGDAPPRKCFAEKWHPLILKQMPNIKLTVLIGQCSQEYYLGANRKTTLTETVRAFKEYLPRFLPLIHPSPRNNIWLKKNPWFKQEVIPKLQTIIRKLL